MVSIGYGVLSSIVPVFNSEVYLAATQVGALTSEVTTAVGLAVGHTIGKTATFVAIRRGSNLPWLRRLRERERKPVGPLREKVRHRGDQLLAAMGRRRYGVPVVFVSAAIGIPPLFAVTLAGPATKMPAAWFAVAVLVGRTVFFLAIAFGISALVRR